MMSEPEELVADVKALVTRINGIVSVIRGVHI